MYAHFNRRSVLNIILSSFHLRFSLSLELKAFGESFDVNIGKVSVCLWETECSNLRIVTNRIVYTMNRVCVYACADGLFVIKTCQMRS